MSSLAVFLFIVFCGQPCLPIALSSADVISPLLDKLSQTLSTIETFAQSLSLSKQVIGVVRRIISFMAKIPGKWPHTTRKDI